MIRNLSVVYILLFYACGLSAQNQVVIDSLLLELNNKTHDTVRVNLLLDINSLYLHEDYIEAASYAEQALDIANDLGLPRYQAKANRALALTYFSIGDYKNATSSYFIALHHYEVLKDTIGLVVINNNLGAIHDRLHDFDKALTYYFKALDLLNQLQKIKSKWQPALYNNIANIYQSRGEIASAEEYYEKGLKIARKTNNMRIQGTLLNNLGKLSLNDLQQFDQAYQYLSEGLSVRKALGDKGELAKSFNIIADYYVQSGQLDSARYATQKALVLGNEVGSLEAQKYAYFNISEIAKSKKEYKAALAAFETFKKLSDSLQNQETSSEVARLQLKYDFEKAEQQRKLEQQQARQRYITIIIILAACLLIAMLIAIIIRSRSKQSELKHKNLEQDVEIKNKELTTNVMYLIRKNELINDVAERLLKIRPNVLPENNKVLRGIIIDLQKEADNDTWQEFELRFNQVHTEFYDNLRRLYPELSPSDEKLCAFLRLSMSSKEIAAITQQSVKSVEVARARLRKKLHLTNTTKNLITHLSSI